MTKIHQLTMTGHTIFFLYSKAIGVVMFWQGFICIFFFFTFFKTFCFTIFFSEIKHFLLPSPPVCTHPRWRSHNCTQFSKFSLNLFLLHLNVWSGFRGWDHPETLSHLQIRSATFQPPLIPSSMQPLRWDPCSLQPFISSHACECAGSYPSACKCPSGNVIHGVALAKCEIFFAVRTLFQCALQS